MTRISSAMDSSDLSHREGNCDADTVRALGLVGMHRSLGVLLIEAMEACAGDSADSRARITDLTLAVRTQVHRQSVADGIRVSYDGVARQLVRELILDRCGRCQGRGFLPLSYGLDSPDDSRGEDCPTCLGSGRAKRDADARKRAAGVDGYGPELDRFWQALEQRMAEAEMDARWNLRQRFRE